MKLSANTGVLLFKLSKGRHILIGCFATLQEAQQAAEEF